MRGVELATTGQDGGARGRPTFGEGGLGALAAGADTASVVPAERFLPELLPRVVGEDPVVV